MLTLITYPPAFGQPSASPFCVKAEYLLNASGLTWQREDSNDPRKAPRAKFPVLRTPDGLVHDSDSIRIWLSENGGDQDGTLTQRQRATSHFLRRMVEEHLYFVLVLDRWERDEVWPIVRDTYFHEIPALLRGIVSSGLRRSLLAGMRAQGLGRLTWDERMSRVTQDLDSLRACLSENTFLVSDAPTSVDASVAAILGAIRAAPVVTALSEAVATDDVLTSYIERVHGIWGNSAASKS